MNPIQLITETRQLIVYIYFAILLAIVFLAVCPPIPRSLGLKALRILYISVITWPTFILFRIKIDSPWMTREFEISHPNEYIEGLSGNAVVILLGWLPAIFIAGGILLIIHVIQKLLVKSKS